MLHSITSTRHFIQSIFWTKFASKYDVTRFYGRYMMNEKCFLYNTPFMEQTNLFKYGYHKFQYEKEMLDK